jgi:hypothetical protein
MSDWPVPTFTDAGDARADRGAPSPTPLFRYPALDELLGTRIHVKHGTTNRSARSRCGAA